LPVLNRDADYAVRALAKLAVTEELTSAASLAESQDVPVVFLRKIMQRLLRAGIVESRQGPLGGYSLARAPKDITLRDVVEAVQGPVLMNACFADAGSCPNTSACLLHERLGALQEELNASLSRITLQNMIESVSEG
jgi:Rrf2 family protein